MTTSKELEPSKWLRPEAGGLPLDAEWVYRSSIMYESETHGTWLCLDGRWYSLQENEKDQPR